MSEYIIHNIHLEVSLLLDLDGIQEADKPVNKFPNYYLGKYIGGRGNELNMNRPRQGGVEEHVPNLVLRNENGIALIRVHNKENITFYDLPEKTENEMSDCVGVPKSNYPFGYVVVDYRDGKCQVAIEKTSAWDSKTVTIRNSLQNFFRDNIPPSLGITTTLREKGIKTQYEKFIDQRVMDHGDVIESFTFQYVNLKSNPTVRIPEELTEEMEMRSKILDLYGAISSSDTMKMGSTVNTDKLKQLSRVVAMCADNAFDLTTHFRDYGDYTFNEEIVAKYPMNDIVISHYKDFSTPDIVDSDHDLEAWLDYVFGKVKEGEEQINEIPTKPM